MSGQNPVGAMQLGPCLVDSESCSVERDGERSKVTPRSMDVLLYLAEHADRIVSSDELLDTFWSPLASDHAVHKAIAELRSALGDSVRAQRFIKTIPKRGYKLLVVPAAVEEEKPESRPMPGLPDRILQWLRYLDPRVLVTGLLVVLSIGALSLFHPHLALAPAGRSSLILAQFPFQLQSSQESEASLFAQGLYSNLVTRLSEVEALRIIPMGAFGHEREPFTAAPLPGGQADFEVHGVIVQTGDSASLYVNLVRSSSGIVEYSKRLEVITSAAPEVLDPLTDQLVELITSHLLLEGEIAMPSSRASL